MSFRLNEAVISHLSSSIKACVCARHQCLQTGLQEMGFSFFISHNNFARAIVCVHVYGFNQNKNKLCSVECKNWFNYENQIGSINQRSIHEERSKFSSRLLLLRGNASFFCITIANGFANVMINVVATAKAQSEQNN